MEHATRLTGINLDGKGNDGRIPLPGLHRRLNLLIADSTAIRQRLRRFLQAGMAAAGPIGSSEAAGIEAGNLQFQQGPRIGTVEILRDRIQVSEHAPSDPVWQSQRLATNQPLLTAAQREVFSLLQSVDCDPEAESNHVPALHQAGRLYVRNFLGERGAGYWRNEAEYLRWTEEARIRKNRAEPLQAELRRREAERSELTGRIAECRSTSERRSQTGAELATARQSVQHLTSTQERLEQERDRLDREIAALETGIQSLLARPAVVPVADPTPFFRFVGRLERIDEVDQQLLRVDQLMQAIQDERVRLREEASETARISLEAEEHPFHRVSELVGHLDAILAETDAAAHQTVETGGEARRREIRFADYAAAHEFATDVTENCERQRVALRGLCGELENQYRHVRHRATVAEMKQLRRCFEDLASTRQTLVDRRQELAEEARHLDPELARAVEGQEAVFLQQLRTQGWLAVRGRWVGTPPVWSLPATSYYSNPLPPVATGSVFPAGLTAGFASAIAPSPDSPHSPLAERDLPTLRQRLLELTQRRQAVAMELAQVREQLLAANSRVQQLATLLDSLRGHDLEALQRQDADLQALVASLRGEWIQLQRLIEEDAQRPVWIASPALAAASALLSQLSGGQYLRFETVPAGAVDVAGAGSQESGLQVVDARGRSWTAVELPAESRRDFRLALAFAAQRQMAGSSQSIPLLLELSGNRLSDVWMARLTQLLEQQGLADHQLLVLCDRMPVLSSSKGLDQNDLLRIFDLQRLPSAESTARIISWQSIVQPVELGPVVHEDPVELRPAIVQPAHRFSSTVAARPLPARQESPGHTVVEVAVTGETLLRDLGICPPALLAAMEGIRCFTLGDLMDLDPEDLDPGLVRAGLAPEELERMQAAAWLMQCVPGLSALDARILVQCGITEPEQLRSIPIDVLLQRIQRYLAQANGSLGRETHGRYTADRLGRWMRNLDSTRPRWRSPKTGDLSNDTGSESAAGLRTWPGDYQTGYFSRPRPRNYRPGDKWFEDQERNRPILYRTHGTRPDSTASHLPRTAIRQEIPLPSSRREELPGEPRERTLPQSAPRDRSNAPPVSDLAAQRDPGIARDPRPTAPLQGAEAGLPEGMQFYLDLDDNVEAAPSIGPKTALRFEEIGVRNIREFLRNTAESMAERINYKRLNANTIREWQDQSRLVCRIPNLRDHDAQLLVACGIREAEQLERMSPRQVFDLVGPFSETKEGLRIIRSGKKPDLAEVADWIRFAKHTRSLSAA